MIIFASLTIPVHLILKKTLLENIIIFFLDINLFSLSAWQSYGNNLALVGILAYKNVQIVFSHRHILHSIYIYVQEIRHILNHVKITLWCNYRYG